MHNPSLLTHFAMGLVIASALAFGCSDSTQIQGGDRSGGATSSGGHSGSGGVVASGGDASGGSTSASGGVSASGGSMAKGGSVASGGAATGGTPGSGGRGTGGASPSSGGATGSGGAGRGGTTSAAGGRSSGGAIAGSSGAIDGGGGQAGGSSGGSEPVKSTGCGTATTAKTGKGFTLSVGGTNRTYNLRIPDNYDNNHAYRLIVSYHWLGGTADNVTDGGVAKPYYGLWDLAQNSTIFVAPQGTGNAWNNSGGADVEFSRQLITQLENTLCIDKSRIFCEGFSMGGSMSYAMACGMGDVIRAVAVHSGGTMSGCAKHDKPVAYFMTHGIKDSVCTYPGFALPPLMDFAKMDGCKSPDPTLSQSAFEALLPEPTSTAGVCLDFTGCQAGYPVRSCLFVGDHTPSPDGTNGWVPKESWRFLSQF